MKNKKVQLSLGLLSVFAVFAIGTWGIMTLIHMLGSGMSLSERLTDARAKIESEPKTESCPLNGELFTKTERDIWEERRPMGVTIENHEESRPLSGISKADIVYEAVAEGGITRLLGLYYCNASASDIAIGPIRSSRVYFIDWISEYGKEPLYVHFGGANDICTNEEDPECDEDGTKRDGKVDRRVLAIEKLRNMGWRHSQGNALDGGANAGAPAIVRNQYRVGEEPAAWEHSAIGSTDLLFDLGEERGFSGRGWDKTFESWKFEDGEPNPNPDASEINFEFWPNKPNYDVEWTYDPKTNSYLRLNGGEPQTDWEYDNLQVTASNIAIMFIEEESSVDEELHTYYHTTKGGDAIIFQNGTIVEGSWSKSDQYSRTKFYDKDGKEISFVRGKIWIEAVPNYSEVLYN